ncbi:MAG: GNAT family N-acetyltransferase [Rhizobium sp.]|nr:GNAT family N-acetyltransferase [Rhizobium sp.]
MTALVEHRDAFALAALPFGDAGRNRTLPRQPLIRTGRLTLRRPEARDAEAITEALDNYRVAKMLTRVPQPYHLDDAGDWLAMIGEPGPEAWIFAITLGGVRAILAPEVEAANGNVSDRLVGVVSIEWRGAGSRTGWHLGYWLAEEHWGRGIMTDAVNAAVARFFSVMMGETLFSSVMADNPGSLRIQGKLGFAITGVEDVYSQSRSAGVRLITTELTFGGYMPM